MAKRRKKKPKRERVVKAKRERQDPKPRGLMALLSVDPGPWAYWLLLIVAFGYVLYANRDMQDGHETLKWRETTGTIVETDISRTSSGGSSSNPGRAGGGSTSSSTTWHVEVGYRYEVNGQAFSGNRIGWGDGSWSYDNESDARAKVHALKAQPKIPVFYDPRRPSEAVLVRGVHTGKLVIGVAGVGGAVGLLVFSYMKQRPVRQDLPPKKRQGPMIRRALLGGFIALVIGGGFQYLAFQRMFA